MLKALMDLLDSRTNIKLVLEQEKKWMDSLKIACVTPKGRDPAFVTSVAWLIRHGYIPEIGDHQYHNDELVLVNWIKGDSYRETHHWEALGLTDYEARHIYCSMRGEDLSNDCYRGNQQQSS